MTLRAASPLLWRRSVARAAQTRPAPLAAPTGNAQRGKTLFETTLRCYACHGFDGQTGSPRLVPMARAEDVFLAYVRKPATPGMPSFAADARAGTAGRLRVHPIDPAGGAGRRQRSADQRDSRSPDESELMRRVRPQPDPTGPSKRTGPTELTFRFQRSQARAYSFGSAMRSLASAGST